MFQRRRPFACCCCEVKYKLKKQSISSLSVVLCVLFFETKQHAFSQAHFSRRRIRRQRRRRCRKSASPPSTSARKSRVCAGPSWASGARKSTTPRAAKTRCSSSLTEEEEEEEERRRRGRERERELESAPVRPTRRETRRDEVPANDSDDDDRNDDASPTVQFRSETQETLREEAVERHSTARDGPSGRADVRGEGDGNETRRGTVRERERDFVRRRIYGVDGAENARGEDEEREDNGKRRYPVERFRAFRMPTRETWEEALRGVYAEEERAVWNVDCLEDEKGEDIQASARAKKRSGESEKVGEHSRAANVERMLVSRVFVRAGAVRTRCFASRCRERNVRIASACEPKRRKKRCSSVSRKSSRVVPRRNRRQCVPDSRSHV